MKEVNSKKTNEKTNLPTLQLLLYSLSSLLYCYVTLYGNAVRYRLYRHQIDT